MGKPKDQSKKMKVKSSAKARVSSKNSELIKDVLSSVPTMEQLDKDRYKIGRVEISSGGTFQTVLHDGKIVRGRCTGNLALEDAISQASKGTNTNIDLQPLVLVLLAPIDARLQTAEIIALISDDVGSTTVQRLRDFKEVGIKYEISKEDDFFEDASEEEVDLADL
jgi:hypothetical protein